MMKQLAIDVKEVLLIEDDPHLATLVEIHLRDLGCRVTTAYDGQSGLEQALGKQFRLIILDLMLPRLDGLEVLRRIRDRRITTPVIALTARSEEVDKILGLELGADDYITKPFSVREFIARVKAVFRRIDQLAEGKEWPESGEKIFFEHLDIDLGKRKVVVEGRRIELTPKEFDLLWLMASRPGRIFDRKVLLNMVWGSDFMGFEHTVNSHINRLRGKIETNPEEPKYILTVWGVGYCFNEEAGLTYKKNNASVS